MSTHLDKLFLRAKVLCDSIFDLIGHSGCSDEEKFASCMTVLYVVAGSMNMKTITFKEYLENMLIDYENNYGRSGKA